MKQIIIFLTFFTLFFGGFMKQAHCRFLKLCLDRDIRSVIPYEAGDVHSTHVTGMLYEGLMRKDRGGNLICAVADSYEISEDKKTYIFKLKKTFWSNGDRVTAYDFAYSWKKQIDPQFGCSLGCDFYGIKHARACAKGEKSMDALGIRVKDDLTLIVELEYPNPYFLSFVSSRSYLPVNSKADADPDRKKKERVNNGPFTLKDWKINYGLTLEKNPTYWDAKHVQLEGIEVQILPDTITQLNLYEKRRVDYVGSPLSLFLNPESLLNHPLKKDLSAKETSSVFCLVINTKVFPFSNQKLRQALSLAIDRQAIVEGLLDQSATFASGFLSGSLKVRENPLIEKRANPEKAKKLFEQALKELNIKPNEFPSIVLSYRSLLQTERLMMVIQSQWKKILGVNVELRKSDYKIHMDSLFSGNYQIGEVIWCSKVYDPSYVLSFFRGKHLRTNIPNWDCVEYCHTLNAADDEAEKEQRIKHIRKAEEIFLSEMPLIPIYFTKGLWLQNPQLKGVIVSDLGEIDFKEAYFE